MWCWHQVLILILAAGTDEAVVIAPSSGWVASCGALLTAQVALSQYPPPLLDGLSKGHDCLNK